MLTLLMHHFASDAGRRIPFLVTLWNFASEDLPARSVVGFIEHELETLYQCPAPPGLVDLLRTNPLLLSLMCILYRGEGSLPRNRAEVYEPCARLLFRRWDARRRIHQALRAGHLVELALRHLAWLLFTQDDAQIAVTAESDHATSPMTVGHSWPSASFGDIFTYIERRYGAERERVQGDLPVPEEFRQVFRDWAEGKVNLVGPVPESGDSGSQ